MVVSQKTTKQTKVGLKVQECLAILLEIIKRIPFKCYPNLTIFNVLTRSISVAVMLANY